MPRFEGIKASSLSVFRIPAKTIGRLFLKFYRLLLAQGVVCLNTNFNKIDVFIQIIERLKRERLPLNASLYRDYLKNEAQGAQVRQNYFLRKSLALRA